MRILILEDDPLIAMDLEAIVEGQGHQVVGAFGTLAEACEHLGDGFDFALLDIDVLDGKSFGLAASLMEKDIPFAFISASRLSEIPQHLHGVSFIPKPFQEAAVLRSIASTAAPGMRHR